MGGQVGSCTAVIGSMTATLQAEHALAVASIRATVVKIGSGQTGGGCAYGITFPCLQMQNVTHVLSEAGIRIKRLYGGESN